jgi:hypothetical protein
MILDPASPLTGLLNEFRFHHFQGAFYGALMLLRGNIVHGAYLHGAFYGALMLLPGNIVV